MQKKFELTTNTKTIFGRKFFQIKALISFGDVEKDELGGWLEKENSLSQDGKAWVYGNAWVSGNARVSGDAWVYGNARVSGNARVYGDDFMVIHPIGSEKGTLIATVTKDGEIQVCRGCFTGSLKQFTEAVETKHNGNHHAKTYLLTVELIKEKLNPVIESRKSKSAA